MANHILLKDFTNDHLIEECRSRGISEDAIAVIRGKIVIIIDSCYLFVIHLYCLIKNKIYSILFQGLQKCSFRVSIPIKNSSNTRYEPS